jgi:predicted RNase H-like HicB family nuclease
MKRKFTVIITREAREYVARCDEFSDVVARGRSKRDALERIRIAIRKKLEDGSDGGSAPFPHSPSPPPRGPRGPIVIEAVLDKQNNE